MRTLTIEVPEGIARDLVAPQRWSKEAPTEIRRADAQEHVADLVRAELARTPRAPSPTSHIKARVTNVLGHVGHRVTLTAEGGVLTGLHCEDCRTEVPIA